MIALVVVVINRVSSLSSSDDQCIHRHIVVAARAIARATQALHSRIVIILSRGARQVADIVVDIDGVVLLGRGDVEDAVSLHAARTTLGTVVATHQRVVVVLTRLT